MKVTSVARLASTESTAAAGQNSWLLDDKMIAIIYLVLAAFFMYQFYKGYKAKKKLAEPKYAFSRTPKKLNLALVGCIVVFAVLTIISKAYISGAAMLLLAVFFFLSLKEKIFVAGNGIYGDGAFYPWEELRKWGWDKENGDLVLLLKKHGKPEENRVIRVGQENMVAVNDRIREFKLNKSKTKKK